MMPQANIGVFLRHTYEKRPHRRDTWGAFAVGFICLAGGLQSSAATLIDSWK